MSPLRMKDIFLCDILAKQNFRIIFQRLNFYHRETQWGEPSEP